MEIFLYLLIGILAGLVMGTIGVGGGAIIIVSLLYIMQFTQKTAQGTTLLIVAAPVSLLAAYTYYKNGFVNLKAGLIIMTAFLISSFLGAKLAGKLPQNILKIIFGIGLILIGLKIVFFNKTFIGALTKMIKIRM